MGEIFIYIGLFILIGVGLLIAGSCLSEQARARPAQPPDQVGNDNERW